jgi:RNA polymerase sigma-70 factor, ECF subfamily
MTKDDRLILYEKLFFQYHGRLVLFSLKFTGNLQASQDIVQNVFMALWENSELKTSVEYQQSYLFQAVRNRSFNYIRDTRTHFSVEQDLLFKFAEAEKNVYRNSENPYHSLLELELGEKIKSTIDTLPAKCKQVYQLSRNYHLKNLEIAELLDISLKMVEKHISIALRILRKHLSEYLPLLLFLLHKFFFYSI